MPKCVVNVNSKFTKYVFLFFYQAIAVLEQNGIEGQRNRSNHVAVGRDFWTVSIPIGGYSLSTDTFDIFGPSSSDRRR